MCAALPGKKVTPYMIQLVNDFLERMAHTTVILHSDGEVAVQRLMHSVAEKRGQGRTLTRYTPRYSSQSLGKISSAQAMLQAQARTLKVDLEERVKQRIPITQAIYAWLLRHAGWLLARFHLGMRRQSAYELSFGVTYKGCIVRFEKSSCFVTHTL